MKAVAKCVSKWYLIYYITGRKTDRKGMVITMQKILDLISEEMKQAFEAAGYNADLGKVTLSNRPDLCEYQCNGAIFIAVQSFRHSSHCESSLLQLVWMAGKLLLFFSFSSTPI